MRRALQPAREPAAPGAKDPVANGPRPAGGLVALQRAAGNRALAGALSGRAAGVRHLLGAGVAIPPQVRSEEEARFGVSFAVVRLHDGPTAHALAERQLARAFTVGSDVVFGAGRYQPGSQEGRRLLAHELTHVVQQAAGTGGAPPGPVHEAAAEAAARAPLANGGPVRAGPPAAPGVQREPLSDEEVARLTLPALEARLRENEREASVMAISEAHGARLARENLQLKERYAELTRAGRSEAAPPAPDPEIAAEMARINAELAEVEPLVVRLAADVPINPRDYALNTVRGVATRLQQDRTYVAAFMARGGERANAARDAAARLQAMSTTFAPVVTAAESWHTANPAGESLGMLNEELGTSLAGTALKHWERGGWYYFSGAAAYVGTAAVATVDAAEQLLTFGFHEAATAVSQAYTRGDISWNDGERIVHRAAWRSLLTAAVVAAAGPVAGRLGGAAAGGLGLEATALSYGVVAGGISGGLTSAAGLGAQSLLTVSLADQLESPAARAIWNVGLPRGKDWAIAIPIGIILGGLGGARAVQIGNERLIGTIVSTPDGPCRIVAITRGGLVVLKPVGGLPALPPPPPPSDIVLVYDPATGVWGPPPSGLATAPPAADPATAPTAITPSSTTRAAGGPARLLAIPPVRALPPGTLAPPQQAGPSGLQSASPVSTPAAPSQAAVPSTPRTLAAAQRVADTRAALAAAESEAARARARVAAAQADLQAARELAIEDPGNPEATRLVRQAEAELRLRQSELRPLALSEATARSEATMVASARDRIVALETEIVDLDARIRVELDPPGGFTPEQIAEGRRPNVIPATSPRAQPSGATYHQFAALRNAKLSALRAESEALTSTLRAQVEAATPGAAARPVALANAAALDPVLRPVNGVPIDVTTGRPMTTAAWATDHLVSRSEIARDPRFARLSPAGRDHMLLGIPEDLFPLTPEANGAKGGLSVEEWITARQRAGRPFSREIADALRAADLRARAAIEAAFQALSPP